MADFFDPQHQRWAFDTVLGVSVEAKIQGNEELSKSLLESVNQGWCKLTSGQKDQIMAQESQTTSFQRNETGVAGDVEIQTRGQKLSTSLDCDPQHLEKIRQGQVIRTARQMWRTDQETIDEMSQYEVQPGDGFDSIARNTLWSGNSIDGREGEVIENSRSIAKLNGFDRDTYDPKKRSLQPGQTVKVHDVDWQLEMMMQSIGRIDDWVRKEIDGK